MVPPQPVHIMMSFDDSQVPIRTILDDLPLNTHGNMFLGKGGKSSIIIIIHLVYAQDSKPSYSTSSHSPNTCSPVNRRHWIAREVSGMYELVRLHPVRTGLALWNDACFLDIKSCSRRQPFNVCSNLIGGQVIQFGVECDLDECTCRDPEAEENKARRGRTEPWEL